MLATLRSLSESQNAPEGKELHYIYPFITSVAQNNDSRPRIFIMPSDNLIDIDKVMKIAKYGNLYAGYGMVSVFPETIDVDYAMSMLAYDYGCDYLMLTSAANVYSAGFVDNYLLQDMIEGNDMIG